MKSFGLVASASPFWAEDVPHTGKSVSLCEAVPARLGRSTTVAEDSGRLLCSPLRDTTHFENHNNGDKRRVIDNFEFGVCRIRNCNKFIKSMLVSHTLKDVGNNCMMFSLCH